MFFKTPARQLGIRFVRGPRLAHAALDCFAVVLDKFSKLFGRRKRYQVTRDEELIVQTCGRELNLRLIFVAAEDDADGWIVVGSHHLLLEIIEVEIHLSGVPMTKRSDLEIQQYVAAKETMVKDQVDIVMLIADGDPFLPGFKTKTGAQFQKECLQMIEEGGLEIRLAVRGPCREPRELNNRRIARHRGERSGRA